MPARYLPVSRIVNEKWDKMMHWHKPAEYFYYPHILVTPFVTGMNKSREDFGNDVKIYADSGGFQIATQDLKLSSLDILRWQEGIADIAYTVDTPAYSYDSINKNHNMYTREYFEKCMEKSVYEANLMYSAQKNEKMELWAVIQGKEIAELKDWHKAQTAEHDFKGYCVAVTGVVNVNTQYFSWLDALNFAHEIDAPIHWLGRCEPLIAMMLAKLSLVTGQEYTYDTSSTVVGPRFGKYYDPYFHNLIWLSNNKENRPNITELPCDCPICSRHTLDEVADTDYLLLLHNLYCLKRFNDYANVIAKDDELFLHTVNQIIAASRVPTKKQHAVKSKINNIIFGEKTKTKSLGEFY